MSMFAVLAPILFLALSGFFLGKFIKKDFGIISDVIVYVSAPSLLLHSILNNNFSGRDIEGVVAGAGLVILFGIIFARRFLRYNPFQSFLIGFMNSGFIGIPFVYMAYGNEGLKYAIIYDGVCGVLMYSIGLYLVSSSYNKLTIFKLPLIYSAALAVTISYFNIRVPEAINHSLLIAGNSTVPLALILLGSKIGDIDYKKISSPIVLSLIRFGFGAILGIAIASILPISNLAKNVIILMSAMPAPLMGIVFCQKFGDPSDCNEIASSVGISTLISIILLPVLLLVLK